MTHDVPPVEPNVGLIVDAVEAQKRTLMAVLVCNREGAAVPYRLFHGGLSDAARGVLIGKRHADGEGQHEGALILLAEAELPVPVERLPRLPPKLRAGVFAAFRHPLPP